MSRPDKQHHPELQNPFPKGGCVDDNAVLDAFAPLKLTKAYYPHRLPACMWLRLNSLLPKGGLKPFMQRHPDIFCIEAGDAPNMWKFKLLASPIAQPADGGHAQAAIAPSAACEHAAASDPMAPPPGLSNYVSAAPQHPPLAAPPLYSQQDHQWQPMALVPPSAQHSRAAVRQWSVGNVVQFLQTLALGHMADQVMYNGLDGPTLIALIDMNSLEEMFSRIQAWKIIAHIAPAEPANGGHTMSE